MNKPATKARILIVDDDPGLLRLLSDTLGTIGYQITQADSGAKALEILLSNSFDIMITDIKMPDIDGLQLFRKVRRQFSQMPVLFITGVASQEIMEAAEADGFLSKPFRISHIEELIQKALKNKAQGLSDRPLHILIVDQDHNLCDYLSEALTLSNYLPFTAFDSNAAMQQLSDGQFNAVIVNEAILTSDSKIFSNKIKEEYPNLPLIITAENFDTIKNQTDELSGSTVLGLLQKPFKTSEILTLLSRITSND